MYPSDMLKLNLGEGWFDPRRKLETKIKFVNSEKKFVTLISKKNSTIAIMIVKILKFGKFHFFYVKSCLLFTWQLKNFFLFRFSPYRFVKLSNLI